jgi:dipeptidyl aminopeptidase/acylaminoacyl peptidase
MRRSGLALALLACLSPLHARAAAPALEAYGALPNVSNVEISPDGARIALLVGDATHRQVQIRSVSDHKLLSVNGIGSAKVRALQWAGPHYLLIIFSTTTWIFGLSGPTREYFQAAVLDLDHKRVRPLLDGQERALNTINALPTALEIKGRATVFVESEYFPDEHGVLAMYKVDLERNHAERVETGNVDTLQFLLDNQGEAVARADYEQRTGRWTLFLKRKGDWKNVYRQTAMIEHPQIDGLGRDGQSVLLSIYGEHGWSAHEMGLADATLSDPLEALRDKAIIIDPHSRAAIGGLKHDLSGTAYSFFSPADQAAWNGVAKAFPHEQVELASWSEDRKQIAVQVDGPRDGVGYYTVDMTTHQAAWLTDMYASIPPEAVAEKRVISYAAADGMIIPAYLTLPKDTAPQNLPAVVLVHGGPAAQDDPGFDWWSQALASRGYAVLQPQYRGSTGLGVKHLNAGFGEWGRKMQTDISDGVRALVKRGIVDPQRVCIVGASYGGYAALAGATFDPAAYRCAVSLAGPADLRRLLDYERERTSGEKNETLRYWDRFMGSSSPGDKRLDEISPAHHADRAAMPILLIHGLDDTVVPYDQSREMAAALKRAGKPVELVTLKSEDHWLSRGETRLQMLTAVVAFLEIHNPPDKPQSPPKAASPPVPH